MTFQSATKEKENPANAKLELPKGYKPMSSAQLRLEVPDKKGWHRHWFRGTPQRLQRAQQAGYRFVDSSEVDINNFDLAGDSNGTGSTDLGTRISVVSGDGNNNENQPTRLYLMECPEELYKYAQSILEKTVDSVAETLRGGKVGATGSGETSDDASKRYLKKGSETSLFQKRKT
jgi:hypothetical protein